MKAIILAAGMGTRISKKIGNIPKCTVDVCGKPLICRTLELLQSKGISDISMVLGYKHEYVERAVAPYGVKTYVNPFYHVTNSIGSLYFALGEFDGKEDVLICNGDVFWTEPIYRSLAEDTHEIVMLGDRTKADTGDYFFRTDNGRLIGYGKDLSRENRDCEYVGIAKLSKREIPAFRARLLEMIKELQTDKWWENVLYSMADAKDIFVKDVEGAFWAEVDFIEDYERILNYVKTNGCQ